MADNMPKETKDNMPPVPPSDVEGLRAELQQAQKQKADLQQKLLALRIEAEKTMKSDGDLTQKEMAAFFEKFNDRTERVVKDQTFFVPLPENVSSHDLVSAAIDAVNEVQMECLRDQQINGQWGLKWIYAHCRSPTASAAAESDAVKPQVWPEEVRLTISRHFKLVECLVKIGHMSLMDQHQRRQLEVLSIAQADQTLKTQQVQEETTAMHRLGEQLSKLREEQAQQARLQAARTRLLDGLKNTDSKAVQAMLLKTVTVCQEILAGMDGMDTKARERYMSDLSAKQLDQMAELEVLQQHFK